MTRTDLITAVVIVIAVIGGLAWFVHDSLEDNIACLAKGGMMVRVDRTVVCAKLEVIK